MRTRIPVCPHCAYPASKISVYGQVSYSCDQSDGCRKWGPWSARSTIRNPASKKPVNWRLHPMMWVIGCIDSQGAIVANASKEGRTHRSEESRGKRWRWCVHSQDFIFAGPRTQAEYNQPPEPLSDEENFAVCDWLIRHGYADDRCLSEVLHKSL